MYVKFPNAKIVAINTNNLRSLGKAFKLIRKVETCLFLSLSFTRKIGVRARNAMKAEAKSMTLKSRFRNMKRMKAKTEPKIAPLESIAL